MHTYGYPKLIAQVHCEFADGSEQVIVSDESWKLTTDGPIRASNEFDGEEYDARCEMHGLGRTRFRRCRLAAGSAGGAARRKLEAQMIEPIRVTEILEPQQIIEAKPGVWMVDFGQAFYGVVQTP